MMKLIKFIFITICILTITAVLLFFYLSSPIEHGKQVTFEIKKGNTLMEISQNLSKQGLVKHHLFFYYYGRIKFYLDKNSKIHRGKYLLSDSLSAEKILEKFLQKNSALREDEISITIPEGYNIYDIAKILVENNIVKTPEDFITLAQNQELIKKYKIPGDSLEGYLYPTTYFIRKNDSAQTITNRMLKQHFKKFPEKEFQAKQNKLKLSKHAVITLASLVEKETGVAKERGLVSSVYHNRLRKKMKLECDPTVIYALLRKNNYTGKLQPKRGDMKVKSPYNTYLNKGLPPSPIANPSREAILAALNPEKSDFIFFVAKNDKSHSFAKNMRQHNKNIEILRAHRKKRIAEKKKKQDQEKLQKTAQDKQN